MLKKMTLDDLALFYINGFKKMHGRFDKIDKSFDRILTRLDRTINRSALRLQNASKYDNL